MTDAANAPLRDIVSSYLELHPEESARTLEELDPAEVAELIAEVSMNRAAPALNATSPEFAAEVLERMEPEPAAVVLKHLDASAAAPLLARLSESTREAILANTEASAASELRDLMTHRPGTAGSLMDPRVHTFVPHTPVSAAISRLRRSPGRQIFEVYLVDSENKLVGVVPLQAMVTIEDEEQPLKSIARNVAAWVLSTASVEEVGELLERYSLTTLPVVDVDGRLLGVIRHRELLELIERDATADIQSMVGASPEERALSPVRFAVRKRLPWLQINLATAFLAASVVGLFESTIAKYTALAVLLPVVAGQSGNTGSQALAVTLRGLALREIRISQWTRVLVKEAGVGLINGIAVAAVTCIGVYIWSGSAGLTMVIGLAMVGSMLIASATGAVIPIALSAVGQDPAQSSSIVLTTITDIAGFFSFLGLATLFSATL